MTTHQLRSYPLAAVVATILLLIAIPIRAQQIIITDLSPPVVPLSEQTLTMVSVTNGGAAPVQGYLLTTLQDVDLAEVVTLRSAEFTLAPGGHLASVAIDWLPGLRYGSSPASAALRSQGQLVSGDYVVCHALMSPDGEELQRQCFEKRAGLNINFTLIHPTDGAVIPDVRPLLSWEPVAQFGLSGGGISYELQLTELGVGQSAAQALDINVPLLRQPALSTASLLYPPGTPGLELGKTYAWLVRVHQRGREVLISEPWTFTVATPATPAPRARAASYAMATVELGSPIYRFGETIFLGFDNNEGVRELTYSLEDLDTHTSTYRRTAVDLPPLRPGLNTIDLPTAELDLTDGHTYRLTVYTPHRRKYFLRFQYAAP
jgi:hypothetical protein